MTAKGEENTPPQPTNNSLQDKKAVLMPLATLLVDEFFKQYAKNKEQRKDEERLQGEQTGSDILSGINRRTSKKWGEPF